MTGYGSGNPSASLSLIIVIHLNMVTNCAQHEFRLPGHLFMSQAAEGSIPNDDFHAEDLMLIN